MQIKYGFIRTLELLPQDKISNILFTQLLNLVGNIEVTEERRLNLPLTE